MKRLTTICLMAVLFGTGSAMAAYSGGTGEPNNPYLISTVADWQELMATPDDWNQYFLLTADIDLAGVSLTPIGNDQTGWFEGVFDGNGHVIRNAVIKPASNLPSTQPVGLFGWFVGQIKNLGVVDANITGEWYVGGLVEENGGILTSCYATGSVNGTEEYAGGLVGDNLGGTVTSCFTTVSVNGNLYVGGLAGGVDVDGNVTACYATGSVTGMYFVGGLTGEFMYGSIISSCYATGSITGIEDVGGLVGVNEYSNVSDSYATGSVNGQGYVGGLVGYNGYSGSIITSCYATGSVSGGGGGLAGENNGGSIVSCFWDTQTSGQSGSQGGEGLTTAQMKTLIIFSGAGWGAYGWVMADGLDYPRLSWENTGYPAIPGPLPVPLTGGGTEADPYQIRTPADFTVLMWDSAILDTHILLMNDIDVTGETLYPIGYLDFGQFTGVFDGNDHVIRNADINMPSSDFVGIFGYVGSGGQIKNLGVENANITGSSYVGGLVGSNDGNVAACYATGSVNGEWRVGGLAGSNDGNVVSSYTTGSVSGLEYVGGLFGDNYNGNITSSYATGSVNGQDSVGGLVGSNDGNVVACYATGSVSGTGDFIGGLVGRNDCNATFSYATGSVNGGRSVGGLAGLNYYGSLTSCYATGSVSGSNGGGRVGGLVGLNDGSVTSCYATGAVTGTGDFIGGLVGRNYYGSVTASFWDMQTSGQSTSSGGTGETTAEMKTESTFTDAGWDFVNVWKMRDHLEYPHLIWENTPPVACIVGGNKTLEAQGPFGARVTLDGSCSSDADSTPGTNDDINDFNWYNVDPCNPDNKTLLGKGEIIDCKLPLGKNTVLLEVIDKAGATDSNEITVTVQDTTPPEFKLSVTPTVLWPPNHKMVRITPSWTVKDLVDPSPVVSLVGVTCNDNSAATGDIQINNDGSIYLRAEKGRIYTITYKACDASGNCTTRSATVTVPHDNGK